MQRHLINLTLKRVPVRFGFVVRQVVLSKLLLQDHARNEIKTAENAEGAKEEEERGS